MSSSLGFSEYNPSISTNLKKKTPVTSQQKINKKLKQEDDDAIDNAEPGDFTPPPPALSAKDLYKKENPYKIESFDDNTVKDTSINNNMYNKINTNKWNEDYYKQYIPSYNTASNANPDNFGKKINYMIHLLEEQQDIKQGNVTEELVLYCFLGVFMIFIVDSFAKVGKYVR